MIKIITVLLAIGSLIFTIGVATSSYIGLLYYWKGTEYLNSTNDSSMLVFAPLLILITGGILVWYLLMFIPIIYFFDQWKLIKLDGFKKINHAIYKFYAKAFLYHFWGSNKKSNDNIDNFTQILDESKIEV